MATRIGFGKGSFGRGPYGVAWPEAVATATAVATVAGEVVKDGAIDATAVAVADVSADRVLDGYLDAALPSAIASLVYGELVKDASITAIASALATVAGDLLWELGADPSAPLWYPPNVTPSGAWRDPVHA